MEEKLIMGNVLTLTKGICEMLTHATIGSPNNYDVFNKALDEYLELQHKVYAFMEKQGWYVTECTTADKIEKTKEKYNEE